MTVRGVGRAVSVAALSCTVAMGTLAQTYSTSPYRTSDTPDHYPPALPRPEGPKPPRMTFKVDREIELPGPLPGDPLELGGDRAVIPVAGGIAVIQLDPEPRLQILSDPAAESGSNGSAGTWVVAPDGTRRYRSLRPGQIVAQRLKRERWRRVWRLRVPGSTPAPPLIVGRRLVFASLDNQVYAVRRDNGHRLWAEDVGDRVSGSLCLWEGDLPGVDPDTGSWVVTRMKLVLLVTDTGLTLLALDPHDGSRVASYQPAAEERLLPAPIALPDGRVLVAAQGYRSVDAFVRVLRLEVSDENPPVTYNERVPSGGRLPGQATQAPNPSNDRR